MRNGIFSAAVATILVASAAPSHAAVFNFTFDNEGTIVGTGTFSYGGTASVGTYVLTDLSNPSFNFAFGGTTYSDANIATPAGDVLVQISSAGQTLLLNFGGGSTGPFSGSIDFLTSQSGLSFEPNFGSLYFETGGNFGTYTAVAGAPAAVPEPMGLGLLGLGLAGLVSARRRQA